MSARTPRVRMFAGPNGSGKSTLKSVLHPELLGVYLNPDEVERDIRKKGFLELNAYRATASADEVLGFFKNSTLLQKNGLSNDAKRLAVTDGRLIFADVQVNSYFASVAIDFIRQKLLTAKASFTFETVMSHRGKVDLLERAQRLGYRTYLYYIATDDPLINCARVRNRVLQGGHDVPEDKIESRYARSLDLLMEAIRHTNRAYVWDNSGDGLERCLLAEVTEGRELVMRTDQMPAWFKRAVWDKIQ